MASRKRPPSAAATEGSFNCPFCGKPMLCEHWVGWTSDGLTLLPRSSAAQQPLRQGDVIVDTPVSRRVYRAFGKTGPAQTPAPGGEGASP